tara:strand:+ start:2208 stop:2657 length:450 start_codon:yes stop_codon:yes gene_type:complete
MEAKKSLVKKVQYLEGKDFKGQFGVLYKFAVEFENGDVGEYSCKDKENPKFIEGQEQEYQLDLSYPNFPKVKFHNSQYLEKFRNGVTNPYQPPTNKDTDWDAISLLKAKRISRQAAIKAAIERCDKDCPIEVLFEEATQIYEWQMQDKL